MTEAVDGDALRVAMVTGGAPVSVARSRGASAERDIAFIVGGRQLDRLAETASDPETAGSITPIAWSMSPTLRRSPQRSASSKRRFGRLDLLFNNAGAWPRLPRSTISTPTSGGASSTSTSRARSCARSGREDQKRQQPRGGRIINNGSIAAQVPRPHSAAYGAAKHAITGLTKATALDGRMSSIACGQIDLGNARTDQTVAQSMGVLQADGSIRPEPTMDVESVVRAVVMMAGLPLEANVQSMTLIATEMPFIGRG